MLVHGDLHDRNLFLSDAGLGIVDWETARTGLPLEDLLYFLTKWSFLARRLDTEASQRAHVADLWCGRLLDGPGSAVYLAVGRYLDTLALPGTLVAPALVATWTGRALAVRGHDPASPSAASVRYHGYLSQLAADGAGLLSCHERLDWPPAAAGGGP